MATYRLVKAASPPPRLMSFDQNTQTSLPTAFITRESDKQLALTGWEGKTAKGSEETKE